MSVQTEHKLGDVVIVYDPVLMPYIFAEGPQIGLIREVDKYEDIRYHIEIEYCHIVFYPHEILVNLGEL